MTVVAKERTTPLYKSIADDLRAAIESGALAVGDQLPSRDELIHRYHTSGITVRAAIQVLVAQGLVYAHQGQRARVIDPAAPAPAAPVPPPPRHRFDTEDLQASVYDVSRVCDKLMDMARRDGYLHPATMNEFTHAALRLQLMADRLWQQREQDQRA